MAAKWLYFPGFFRGYKIALKKKNKSQLCECSQKWKLHLNLSTQSISLTLKISGARSFHGNRGACGQKLLYMKMKASNAVGFIFYGSPGDVSLAIRNIISSDFKKGNNFFSQNKNLVIGNPGCGTDVQLCPQNPGSFFLLHNSLNLSSTCSLPQDAKCLLQLVPGLT